MKPNNKSVTLTLAALRPLQSLWTDCSTSHSRGILTEFLHEQGSGWVYDRKTSSSRLSDSGEEAKVKGTRKVGGMGKREKEAPALPSFLPFYFVFALFQFSGPDYLRAWNRLNCLQMSFQKQLIFVSYLKTLTTAWCWLNIAVILDLNKKTNWSGNQTWSLDSGSCSQMTEMISLWKWPFDRVRILGSITAKKCKRLVNSCCRRGCLKPGQTVLMILSQDSPRESLLTPSHNIPQEVVTMSL